MIKTFDFNQIFTFNLSFLIGIFSINFATNAIIDEAFPETNATSDEAFPKANATIDEAFPKANATIDDAIILSTIHIHAIGKTSTWAIKSTKKIYDDVFNEESWKSSPYITNSWRWDFKMSNKPINLLKYIFLNSKRRI